MEDIFDKLSDAQKEKYKNFCSEAVFVQDACNLSGCVFAFARAMEFLCELSNEHNLGTKWKNNHPISVMYSSKIASLTNSDDYTVFGGAYDYCRKYQ